MYSLNENVLLVVASYTQVLHVAFFPFHLLKYCNGSSCRKGQTPTTRKFKREADSVPLAIVDAIYFRCVYSRSDCVIVDSAVADVEIL